jgi:hypothetical protein
MGGAATLALAALFWSAVGLVQIFNWNHGIAKAAVLLCLLLAVPALIARLPSGGTALPRRWQRIVALIAGAMLLAELGFAAKQFLRPHVIDVATTTLAAGLALLHGQNPYELTLDPMGAGLGFTGFKYPPMMAAIYLPLGLWLGERGVVATNLALFLAALALLARLARREAGAGAALLAPALFLILPMVPQQLFAKGATDLAPVVPLLLAALCWRERPGLSGFLIGLSIATKPLPGGMFLACLLPAGAAPRLRYGMGVVIGLLPILPFLLWSPDAFLDNVVRFDALRPADTTSWLAFAPPQASGIARAALLVMLLSVIALFWRRDQALLPRLGLAAMLTLGAILAGPAAHHNYQLWWLPFYALILAAALETCQAARLSCSSARGSRSEGG